MTFIFEIRVLCMFQRWTLKMFYYLQLRRKKISCYSTTVPTYTNINCLARFDLYYGTVFFCDFRVGPIQEVAQLRLFVLLRTTPHFSSLVSFCITMCIGY